MQSLVAVCCYTTSGSWKQAGAYAHAASAWMIPLVFVLTGAGFAAAAYALDRHETGKAHAAAAAEPAGESTPRLSRKRYVRRAPQPQA